MDIEARKFNLIQRVINFNESELNNVEIFLKRESELSSSLDRALKQVEDGKVTSHDEVKKKYEKWL